MASEPVYETLDVLSSQIRLLRLLPVRHGSFGKSHPWYDCTDVECSLETMTLANAPAFEALSYAWGEETSSVTIRLNGKQVSVRPNLGYALAAMRTSEPRLLWIDALCVNQEDYYERNHQVRFMGEIYCQAMKVLVWLGRPATRWDSSLSAALAVAETFSECYPTSFLLPPPPDPGYHNESKFDQWLGPLRLPEDYGEFCDKLQNQREHWSAMKMRHELHDRKRLRIPEMLEDLQVAESSYLSKRHEAHVLRRLEAAKRQELEDITSRSREEEARLEQPLQRLLQDFKTRQATVLRNANESVRNGQFTGLDSKPSRSLNPQNHHRHEEEGLTLTRCGEFGGAKKLNDEILEELGHFQSSIYWLRKSLEQQSAQESLQLQTMKSRLEYLQEVDVSQRRALRNLQHQLRQLLRNEQHEFVSQLSKLQDRDFLDQAQNWQSLQDAELDKLGTLSNFLTGREEALQNWTARQRRLLRRHAEKIRRMRVRRSYAEVDELLTREELDVREDLEACRLEAIRKRLDLRETELRRREAELIVERYDKCILSLHDMNRQLPTAHEDRQESVAAQAEWVQLWEDWRHWESQEWQQMILKKRNIDRGIYSLGDICSLISIFELPYWRRLWIVQEVLLAKELVLCFGDNARTVISWELLTRTRVSLRAVSPYWKLIPALEEYVNRIKDTSPLRLDMMRQGNERRWPLFSLIEMTKTSLCQDPRDKIYGLLGLASDFSVKELGITYEKPVAHVLEDAIRCYYRVNAEAEAYPSLIRFSQELQISLRAHNYPPQLGGSLPLLHSGSNSDVFCIKGNLHGAVLPLDQLLEAHELQWSRNRDWISTLAEYLDHNDSNGSRFAIEEELLLLDSISTGFSLPDSCSVYVSKRDEPVTEGPDLATLSVQPANRPECQYFIYGERGFGISSAQIREGDLLCEFQDSQLALVVRPCASYYTFVSKAIISRTGGQAPNTESSHEVVQAVFDAASLQYLTIPVDFLPRTRNREGLCVQEADFGWYEFITFGQDMCHY